MSTTGLLSQLRCAHCRQLTFDKNCSDLVKLGFTIWMGSTLLYYLGRWTKTD